MPVSRARKKKTAKAPTKKKKYKPYEVVKQPFVETTMPGFGDIPFEERIEILQEFAKKSGIEYETSKVSLQRFLDDYDPLDLMSYCLLYFVSGPEGIDKEAIDGYVDFPVFYVEVLQALALTRGRNLSDKCIVEEAFEFKNVLTSFNKNQTYRYFNLAEHAKSPDDLNPVMLRMDMMINTLAVRNWAYESQMLQVAFDLADTVRKKFKDAIGFDPYVILDILFGLTELTNDKLNEQIKKMKTLHKAKTVDMVFLAHEQNYTNTEQVSKDEKEKMWEMCGKNLKQLKWALLTQCDLHLKEVFTFDLSEIKNLIRPELEIDEIHLSKLLNDLSMEFGDLAEINTDHIFLNNPVHLRPFIALADASYFSAITYMFPHLGVDLLETFMRKEKDLSSYYNKQKGTYLERAVRRCFENAFPDAKIFEGSLWKSPVDGKTYENDLIVLIENFAIIVESKSGTVAAPARRGAPNRLFETLTDLIVAPSEQAIRFEQYLKKEKGPHIFKTKSGVSNQFDSSLIEYYVPLGVTLSNLGSIGCNLKKLINAKVIGHTIDQLAPSISLCDLQVIFEVLDSEAEKIHYLSRRREFDAHAQFEGDELDLLGFYLDTGFNIGDTEYDPDYHLNLTLKSKELDPYFVGKYRGKLIKKPKLRLTKFWKDLLFYLRKNSKQWLQTSLMLLNVSPQDQADFQKAIEKLKNMILKGNTKDKHNWATLYCGPERRRYSIIAYAYRGLTKAERNDVMNHIAEKEHESANRGFIIIGFDLDKPIYPYNVIAGSNKHDFFDSLFLAK